MLLLAPEGHRVDQTGKAKVVRRVGSRLQAFPLVGNTRMYWVVRDLERMKVAGTLHIVVKWWSCVGQDLDYVVGFESMTRFG